MSTQDWLDNLVRAKELALSQALTDNPGESFSYADSLNNLSNPAMATSVNTLDAPGRDDTASRGGGESDFSNNPSNRAILHKAPSQAYPTNQERRAEPAPASDLSASVDGPAPSGRSKRFSKRASKGVLAAVF